jgi:hypothetical protein
MTKVWETIERKWIETLFSYKQQKEALSSQVKSLTKEKKKKENVLTNLMLRNLKSAFLFNYEKIRRTTIEAKIRKSWKRERKSIKRIYSNCNIVGKCK